MRAASLILIAGTSYAADLPHRLDSLIDNNPLSQRSNIGIEVVDLKTGKSLFGRNEGRFFLPASNMKLFTSALALVKLGPDYQFVTRLIRDSSGDLVLVGSGDPSMNGRAYPYKVDAKTALALSAIEELADQAVAAGLREVSGDVVGDDRVLPWSPYPPSWTQDDAVHESGAPISALSVADNVVTISISPAASAGELARIALDPALEYFAIDNRVTTVAGAGLPQIRVSRTPGTRQILLSGTIPLKGGGVREQVAVDDPALYAACALYDALTRRGVLVKGRPVARHRSAPQTYEAPAGETLATRTSPPLSQLLQVLDKVSENLHAELMFRAAGGPDAMSSFLTEIGATPGESRIDDGSGLSRNDQVTPKLVTRLLAHMYKSKDREVWISLLPIGGEDGTLSKRLCCASDSHLIHAKTGTLARAIALSGYAESNSPDNNKRWLAFSILINNFAASASEVQAWVDKIALTLVE
jgi:D-alanyl-D-alanine carboxypeptidase/D-alanyl-D-alanine-endopeptidase (penicillin-binding protein 4)